jgi:cell division protein FtsQ
MRLKSEIQHSVLLLTIVGIISFLAFSLEGSEINNISKIRIIGNKYLDESNYLKFAKLENIEYLSDLSISLIKDRIGKHPYVENCDVLIIERGIAEVTIYEKKMDAIVLNNNKQFIITDRAEIIPLVTSTMNLNLPVIIYNTKSEKVKSFVNATNDNKLFSALKIISTAELYDNDLYRNISEINLNNKDHISIYLSQLSSPIYFGKDNEIETTVFLSKIYKQMQKNEIKDYLNYVDLRFNELVYLGFDEKLTRQKEAI